MPGMPCGAPMIRFKSMLKTNKIPIKAYDKPIKTLWNKAKTYKSLLLKTMFFPLLTYILQKYYLVTLVCKLPAV